MRGLMGGMMWLVPGWRGGEVMVVLSVGWLLCRTDGMDGDRGFG